MGLGAAQARSILKSKHQQGQEISLSARMSNRFKTAKTRWFIFGENVDWASKLPASEREKGLLARLIQRENKMTITRRSFMEMAVALGAAAAWGQPVPARPKVPWHERRDLYPEGVASGDPQSSSVLLWTRRAPKDGNVVKKLTVEVASDASFTRVAATADARKSLLAIAEQWARSHGCTTISVRSNVTRERAHRFCTRNGYEHAKTQKLFQKQF
jgi:hypothetical protein